MAVALAVLAAGEETLWGDQREAVACPCHAHIEKAPLLLDLCGGSGGEIGRYTAIDAVQHEDGAPFLPLAGMDGRKDQVVLVQERHARLIAGGIRRIERQFGEEAFAVDHSSPRKRCSHL